MNRIDLNVFISLCIVWNMIVFLIYQADKSFAKKGKRRISENTLIFSALPLGGIGALLAMKICRHKTKHLKFKIAIPIAFILNIGLIALVVFINI